MKPVRILVDSTVDLPERCRAQVRAVPLTVHFGDEELIDGVTIDRRRFYERLIGVRRAAHDESGHSGGLCQRI